MQTGKQMFGFSRDLSKQRIFDEASAVSKGASRIKGAAGWLAYNRGRLADVLPGDLPAGCFEAGNGRH
jgi:hypothetical protein